VRDTPSLLDRHQPETADDGAAVAALRVAVLNDEALQARRGDLDAEAAKLAIPAETLPNLDPNLGRFGSLERVHDALCELFA